MLPVSYTHLDVYKRQRVAFEVGYDQAEAVRKLLEATGQYSNIQFIADLGGHNRVVTAVYEG